VRADANATAAVAAAAAAKEEKPAAGPEKGMSYFKPVLDIEAIKGVLPHRCVRGCSEPGSAMICCGSLLRACQAPLPAECQSRLLTLNPAN
jgi:hypothetical protein